MVVRASDWSGSSFAAANCNEWGTAYDLSADEATRRAQAVQRLAAQPANLYGIFSHALFGNWEECWAWPGPQRVNRINPPGTPYSKVPVLVMAGDLNTDHPPTAARTVASRYPNATFVTHPARVGSRASYWSACAARIAQHFMNTATAGDTRCAANEGKAVLGHRRLPEVRPRGDAGAPRVRGGPQHRTRPSRRGSRCLHRARRRPAEPSRPAPASPDPRLRGGTWSPWPSGTRERPSRSRTRSSSRT